MDELSDLTAEQNYPEQYLHVEECRSAETWIVPIGDDEPLDIEYHVDEWIKREYCGEMMRSGDLMPRIEGDYYAQIKTDGTPPESPLCWQSGGFFLE